MSDGIYKGYSLYAHDLSIMCTEDILYSIFHFDDVDSLEYLQNLHQASIIRE